MTALKLLMTADTVGGIWQYAVDLAGALRQRGNEVLLVTLGPAPTDAQRHEAREAGARLIETDLPLDWLVDGPAPVLAAGEAVAAIAMRERVDLMHLNMPALAAAALPPIPAIAVAHGCVATWWQAAKPSEPLAGEYRWHRALMNEGLRAAARVIAPSTAYARVVQRHYGLKRLPAVVRNGRRTLVPLVPVTPKPEILTVGRLWDRAKNITVLDAAAARLGVPIHAVGPVTGPHGETVAPTHLHLLGQLDTSAVAERLARRPIFVSTAMFEPFGLAVLEAAAAGCPLVLADIPTFRELWKDAALFVPANDADGFANALQGLVTDPGLRATLGSAARRRAARYTPLRMADGMLKIYGEVLGDHMLPRRAA